MFYVEHFVFPPLTIPGIGVWYLYMNNTILIKLARGGKPSEEDLKNALYEVCDRVHSFCDDECPVFLLNRGQVTPFLENRGCACFKNGEKMLDFIRNHI